MARRTQITLTEEQYERLTTLSEQTGVSLAELIRRAVDRTYAAGAAEALDESFGAWKGRRGDGAAYVERMRTGLAARLDRVGGGAR
jgi:ribbon-helix-helix protein